MRTRERTSELSLVGEALDALRSSDRSYFVGVSVSKNRLFSKAALLEYEHKFCCGKHPLIIVLGDSLEIVNYRHLNNLQFDQAIAKAKRVGRNYYRGYRKLHNANSNIIPVRTWHLDQHSLLRRMRRQVRDFYWHDIAFKDRVRNEVVRNVESVTGKGALKNGPQITLEEYVLGEVAISLFIYAQAGQDRAIQLSPTRVSLLKELGDQQELLAWMGMVNYSCRYVWWHRTGGE